MSRPYFPRCFCISEECHGGGMCEGEIEMVLRIALDPACGEPLESCGPCGRFAIESGDFELWNGEAPVAPFMPGVPKQKEKRDEAE